MASNFSVNKPEMSVSEIKFGITLRSYKIHVKLASSATEQVAFTPTFEVSDKSILSSVRQSAKLACTLLPHHFTFYAQMEKENAFTNEPSVSAPSQQEEVCVFYMAMRELKEDEFLLMRYAVNVVCGCEQETWKSPLTSKENHYLDCSNQPMIAVGSSIPVAIAKHQHDFSVQGFQQEYYMSFTVYDFSKAKVVPLEAQQIMAKKKCALQLRSHILSEWGKPFDVTIKCKGGYSIGAHKAILSVRSRVFKSMLESDFQEATTNTIHVVDLNAPAMKIILYFIYTGELDSEWKEVPVEEIVYGADKYELPELLGFFDHLMVEGCDAQNALRLAALADRHFLTNAKDGTFRFIEANLGAVFRSSMALTVKRH